ncbi:MAG: hypothetical protein ACE10E_10335 [Acidiferrobacterales bacterium]
MSNIVTTFARRLGPLRLLLALLGVIVIVFAPAAGTPAIYSGWSFVLTVLIPVLAPLVFVIFLLDTLMSWVFMSGKDDTERNHYKTILITDAVFAAVIASSWVPYYLALGE